MRLSEAIRLGSMLHPQGFEVMIRGGRTCALGAAWVARGVTRGAGTDQLMEYFDAVPLVGSLCCPSCGMKFSYSRSSNTVGAVIAHLNDTHRWTREAIADWFETQEPRSQTTGEPVSTHALDPVVLSGQEVATRV